MDTPNEPHPTLTAMMCLTIEDIEDLARWALDEFGLTSNGWQFQWDRAVRRAGCCHYRNKTITLSLPIFSIEPNRDEALDMILHEVAHALAGYAAGHGPDWKKTATKIGARPVRCHSLQTPPRPVVGECDCGPIYHRHRLPAGGGRCRRCGTAVSWSRING